MLNRAIHWVGRLLVWLGVAAGLAALAWPHPLLPSPTVAFTVAGVGSFGVLWATGRLSTAIRWLATALAVGLMAMWFVFPGGTIPFVVGLALLLVVNPAAAGQVRDLRARVSMLDRSLVWVEDRLPASWVRLLVATRPPSVDDTDSENTR